MKSKLKLGTRRSLLAWAQSSWVARQVEKLNPGVEVELVGIETRGDRIQDVSLRSVEGKEFFVAELDHALKSGEVDLTVHSMKDLSLERPLEFACAAIPVRENPRDIILFGPHALKHLSEGRSLKIGSSSPRRMENIPSFLKQALPQLGSRAPSTEWVEIRGNVNTRLSRVHEPLQSEKYLDAVVLAFAGINRLWADEAGRKELTRLLQEVRWMVLPLKECPAAPAQGALAIECRKNDQRTREILRPLHDAVTEARVAQERKLLSDWGGGCHQRFGATAVDVPGVGNILFIRGAKPDGSFVESLEWHSKENTSKSIEGDLRPWDGSEWRAEGGEKSKGGLDFKSLDFHQRPVFVAHSRAASEDMQEQLRNARVWTSGTASWYRLAQMGIWVEGCAEGFGFEWMKETLQSGPLGLSNLKNWIVLTHADALQEWQALEMQPVATYQLSYQYSSEAQQKLKNATHVFWSSGSQWRALKEFLPQPGVHHSCGPGKTSVQLRENGIIPKVFPSVEEWKKWLSSQK
jgi:hydroxymethylbilane synthase